MEIRSALWQRLFTVVVFGFIGFIGGAAALKAFFPQQITLIGDNGETPAFLFWTGMGLVLFSLGCYGKVERSFLRAGEDGMIQHTGFRTQWVRWQDVSYYRLEPLRGTREHRRVPVLYDRFDRERLRPVAPLLVGTARQDEEQALFWQFVEQHLEGKKRGL